MLAPFDVLFETDAPAYNLPEELSRLYGRLGFADHVVYSNFVSSLDGVVALESGISAGSVISGRFGADRFLMALLRACADAVVIGAGTLRATPGHVWTPAHVYPDFASSFAALRATLGRSPQPRLVVLTAEGDLDLKHPALEKGATILTTHRGAKRIGDWLPPACELVTLGAAGRLDTKRAFEELGARGFAVILTEGGPHLVGQLIANHLLDEAFLTLSPVIAGRGSERRLGMVEGAELLPSAPVWSRLISVRRQSDFLFLRYALPTS